MQAALSQVTLAARRPLVAMLTLSAIVVSIASAPVAAKPSCVLAGGEATMVTEDLAKFMANAALGNSIKGMGASASGAAKMECKPAALLTYCIARQKACK
jgi:hypothetical protein